MQNIPAHFTKALPPSAALTTGESQMDKRLLESLLAAWARWAVTSSSGGLGYPKESPMFREFKGNTDGYGKSYDPGYVSRDLIEMDRAIKSLTIDERGLIVVRYQRQWSYRKIGKSVGLSHTKIQSLMEHALKKLQIVLDNGNDGFHNRN